MVMNLREVDLNFLVVFEAMFLERNQSRAGKRLNMSQPAVSNALNKLRVIFNDRLFVKTAAGMGPTPKAERLAPHVHKVIQQLKSLYSEFSEFCPETSRQVFRLSMSDYSESVIFPDLINHLEAVAPDIQIKCCHTRFSDRHRFLSTGKLDLAVFSHYPGDFRQEVFNGQFSSTEDLQRLPLFKERVVAIAQRDHPRIHGRMDLETFLDLPHAMISLHNDTLPVDSVDQRLRELGLKRRIKFMTQRTATLAEVVGRTHLIGTMVERYARKYAPCHHLQILDLPFDMAAFEMSMYWHKRVHLDPAHIWLRDMMVSACGAAS